MQLWVMRVVRYDQAIQEADHVPGVIGVGSLILGGRAMGSDPGVVTVLPLRPRGGHPLGSSMATQTARRPTR